jgi:preprotein translocase subunit SecE
MDTPKAPTIASPTKFVKEVIGELKKTTWPTRAETIKLTVIVIAISVLVGAFIGILDTVFLRISALIFRR